MAKSPTAGSSMATSGVLFMKALRPIVGNTSRTIAPSSVLRPAKQALGDPIDAARFAHAGADDVQHGDRDHAFVRQSRESVARGRSRPDEQSTTTPSDQDDVGASELNARSREADTRPSVNWAG